MAYQTLGSKLEIAFRDYLEGVRAPLLDGVDIVTSVQTEVVNVPYLAIFTGSISPFSDPDRRGLIRGPQRCVVRFRLAEEMTGETIDQYAAEFENIISRPRRIGKVNAHTSNSASFVLDWEVPGTAPSFLAANDIIQLNETNRTISSVSAGSGYHYNITLTESVTLVANRPVYIENVLKQAAEYTDVIAEIGQTGGSYKPATGLTIFGMRFIAASPNVEENLRIRDYEFEVDALNCNDLT